MTKGTVRLTRRFSTPTVASRTRIQARVGARLGSPVVLASSIVCLVAVVGLVSTLTSFRSLRMSGERHERATIDERTRGLRASLSEAFSVADAILARIEPAALRADASAHPEELLRTLSDVAFAPRGLTWASVSYPDGTFVGVHRVEGELVGQVSRVADRLDRSFRIDPAGVHETGATPTDYDPRRRGFYSTAEQAEGAVWTEPYPFVPDLHIGVTRTVSVRRDGRTVAVLTADFDATEITKLFGRAITRSERALVTVGPSVLAARGVAMERAETPTARPPRVADFHDPVVAAAMRTRGSRVDVDGEGYRVSRQAIGAFDDRAIELLIVVPERELYASAIAEAKSGMLATAIVALLGLLLATFLSANVASLRRRREEAELAAERARLEVEELGSYELGEKIGSGGMGEVYRATHRLLAREAAVKLIRFEIGDDLDGVMEAFFHEARTLAHLESLHTVEVYDFGVSSDDRYFLAMELLHGLDLDALVRIYGPQRPARVASILAQICDSLAEVHAAGFVHQDIKPANVFLCHIAESLDFVKVLDFGLTRAIGARVGDGAGVEGTPAFMAPEQARGETLTFATDLYAVGCVGYYLLCGRYPYQATSADGYMRAHIEQPIPRLPESVRSVTPDSLQQLITRCLAKKPENRPISAKSLGNVLRRIEVETASTFTEDDRQRFWEARTAIERRAAMHRDHGTGERRTLVRATR